MGKQRRPPRARILKQRTGNVPRRGIYPRRALQNRGNSINSTSRITQRRQERPIAVEQRTSKILKDRMASSLKLRKGRPLVIPASASTINGIDVGGFHISPKQLPTERNKPKIVATANGERLEITDLGTQDLEVFLKQPLPKRQRTGSGRIRTQAFRVKRL